jgi:phosphotransferase system  glucose/maltose/N-acetylglucosamine-specific IIC component
MPRHWNWRQRSLAIVVWPSFLAACLGTLLFFAQVDATRLQDAFVSDTRFSDHAIYSIGFFFFWLIGLVAALMATWLLRTERKRKDFPSIDADH